MFVSKPSKKRFWTNSFSNRLWLATAIIMTAGTGVTIAAAVESPSTLLPEQTTAATARPNVAVDCVRRVTCAECAAAAPACSWSLVHQSCNDTAATEKQLIEDPGDDGHHHPPTKPVANAGSCPRFKVDYQKQTIMDATNRTLNVKVSNDPTGTFRALLERGQVLCHLNEMKFPGKVESGGRQITCQADHLESANSSLSSIVYFYTSVNGAALTFDDKRDHYLDFTVPRNACVTENPVGPSDECKVCLWDDDRAYRYYCQWCPKSNPCTGSYQQCDVRRLTDPGRTVTVKDVFIQCPEVRIESIEPLYGSWAGGTTIRINISNHRTLSENKVTVVKVADSRCLLPTASVDGTTITCTIPPTNSSSLNQGPVEVTYRSEVNKLLPTFTLRSNQSFYFVEPVITNVWPSCGPVTGGTRVTIRGRFLDAGNTVRVYMRDNITCAVQTHSQNEVTCLTGASDGPSASAIRIEFDHYLNKYVYDPPFMYTSAPALEGGQSFRGISSGGTQLPVRGHDFACIHNPLVHVSYNGIQYTGSCAVRNDTYMVCTAPTINRPAPHQVTALQFGFQADYNNTIVKMPLPAGTPDYTLYPDPVYTNFETEGRTVTVYGLNIDQGYDRDADLSVLFHKTGVPCNVTSVQPDRIVCKPPKRLSFNDHGGRSDDGLVDGYGGGGDDDDEDDDDLPAALVNDEIIVTVGNLVYEVKRKPQTRPRTFPIRINTIIFGGIALVSLIITIVAAIVYCMRIAMTISQQQTEMRSLCEHLNSTETGLGVCTGTETGSKADVGSAAAAAPAKDRS